MKDELVTVTQVDREAAAETAKAIYYANSHSFACEADVEEMEGMLVQAFARHRLSALSAPDGGLVERIAAFVEAWNGDTADGNTNCIAYEIREQFAGPDNSAPVGEELVDLAERLRSRGRDRSNILRQMAEAKSLRQTDNQEQRDDLYEWPKPEDTDEWKAADLLAAHPDNTGFHEAIRMAAGVARDDADKLQGSDPFALASLRGFAERIACDIEALSTSPAPSDGEMGE